MAVLTRSSRLRTRVVRPARYAFVPAAKKPGKSKLKQSLKVIAGAAAVAALITAAPAVYREVVTNSYFQISNVEINGLNRLSHEELIAVMRPLLAGSIFTSDIRGAAERIGKNPWVADVSIRRRLPGTLEVNVIERVPAAVLKVSLGKLYFIDRQGYLLAEAPGGSSHVVITGLSRGGAADARLRPGSRIESERLNDAFRINEIFLKDILFSDHAAVVDLRDLDRITVRTKLTGSLIRFGPAKELWLEKFLEYLVVRRVLEETGESFTGIDLSFKGQVVVDRGSLVPDEDKQNLIKG